MSERTISDELSRALARMEVDYAPLGRVERFQEWICEDGWHIRYTTTKVIGGPYDGKFLVQGFKPVGKGSKSGKAETWMEAYSRAFVKRKDAKARGIELYKDHSPKWAEKHSSGGV